MASNISAELKGQISRGEDLATAALQQVFGLSLDPTSEPNTIAVTQADKDPTITSTDPVSTIFKASDFTNDNKRHLLLSCTGSVATIKLPQILHALSKHSSQLSVRVVLTESASRFLAGQSHEQATVQSLRSIPGVDGIYLDRDEWEPAWTRGAPILHIELRRWADALAIAPLSANSLARIVNGICDDLLTSVVRAWDTHGFVGFGEDGERETHGLERGQGEDSTGVPAATKARAKKMIFMAPAMNTAMWQHPLTGKQIKVLEDEWEWVTVLRPVEKSLACGDIGSGAMKEWSEIVKDVEELLQLSRNN